MPNFKCRECSHSWETLRVPEFCSKCYGDRISPDEYAEERRQADEIQQKKLLNFVFLENNR